MGFVRKLTGADEAEKAAQAAERQGERQIAMSEEARQQILGLLTPFQQAGQGVLPQLQQAATQQKDLGPLFSQIQEDVTQRIMANQAAKGRLGSGSTVTALTSALAPLRLQQELGQEQRRFGNLLNLANLGLGAGQSAGQAILGTGQQIGAGIANVAGAQQAYHAGRARAQGDLFNYLTGQGFESFQGGLTGGGSGGSGDLMQMAGSAIGDAIVASDERVKENIQKVGKTDKGDNLYKYNYKADPTKKVHIGVMAQEIEKTNPKAVVEFAGIKMVDYNEAV